MRISREKAVALIDQKMFQFQVVYNNATFENRHDETYSLAYYGTETLLTELFSKEEAMNFRSHVTPLVFVIGGPVNHEKELKDYRHHIEKCIAQLKVYKERIQNFWPTDEVETTTRSSALPFVSMSFDESDRDVNDYFTGILASLCIDFETGERYSKDSIPQKVQSRIRSCDMFIVIFVRRDKIKGGGYTTPSWLLKELGIAEGAGKEIIALVERGIKDIAGLDYEKQVIYFDRDNPTDMKKSTRVFLEALRVHGLV